MIQVLFILHRRTSSVHRGRAYLSNDRKGLCTLFTVGMRELATECGSRTTDWTRVQASQVGNVALSEDEVQSMGELISQAFRQPSRQLNVVKCGVRPVWFRVTLVSALQQ
jgi:hypothetical protein